MVPALVRAAPGETADQDTCCWEDAGRPQGSPAGCTAGRVLSANKYCVGEGEGCRGLQGSLMALCTRTEVPTLGQQCFCANGKRSQGAQPRS